MPTVNEIHLGKLTLLYLLSTIIIFFKVGAKPFGFRILEALPLCGVSAYKLYEKIKEYRATFYL